MDMLLIWLEFAVLLACIVIGSRYGGVGLGLWGSFGVFVLTYVVGLAPTSPVSAAMAAMIALFEPMGFGLPQILLVSVPATLTGVIVAALVQTRVGKNLQDDPDYQGRLRAGEIEPSRSQASDAATPAQLPPGARLSALIFLAGVAFIVVSGFFPGLRPQFPGSNGSMERLSMTLTIQLVMLALSAIMLWLTKPAIESIPRTKTAQAGLTAIIGIFGLAWLGDTFIQGNEAVIIGSMSAMVKGFCQVVGVETLIRQVGASPRSYPPVRQLAPCL